MDASRQEDDLNGTEGESHGYAMHVERDGLETKIRVRLSKNIMLGNNVVDISDGNRIIVTVNIREGEVTFTSKWVKDVEESRATVSLTTLLGKPLELRSWKFIIEEYSA